MAISYSRVEAPRNATRRPLLGSLNQAAHRHFIIWDPFMAQVRSFMVIYGFNPAPNRLVQAFLISEIINRQNLADNSVGHI